MKFKFLNYLINLMVKMIPQDVLPKNSVAITIKKNYQAGMRPIEIAKLFKISMQKIN